MPFSNDILPKNLVLFKLCATSYWDGHCKLLLSSSQSFCKLLAHYVKYFTIMFSLDRDIKNSKLYGQLPQIRCFRVPQVTPAHTIQNVCCEHSKYSHHMTFTNVQYLLRFRAAVDCSRFATSLHSNANHRSLNYEEMNVCNMMRLNVSI